MFTLSKLLSTMLSNKRQTVSSFHGEDQGDFWGFCGRAFRPSFSDPTDCPWVSEDGRASV